MYTTRSRLSLSFTKIAMIFWGVILLHGLSVGGVLLQALEMNSWIVLKKQFDTLILGLPLRPVCLFGRMPAWYIIVYAHSQLVISSILSTHFNAWIFFVNIENSVYLLHWNRSWPSSCWCQFMELNCINKPILGNWCSRLQSLVCFQFLCPHLALFIFPFKPWPMCSTTSQCICW